MPKKISDESIEEVALELALRKRGIEGAAERDHRKVARYLVAALGCRYLETTVSLPEQKRRSGASGSS